MGLSISAHHDEGMHHAMQAKRESRGDREREKDSSSRCTRTVLFRISFFITPQAFALYGAYVIEGAFIVRWTMGMLAPRDQSCFCTLRSILACAETTFPFRNSLQSND
eukprot:TRINITY_DN8843_c0_g1_i2.p1 TRINITY_DN8843_c0_g1~~TRINITY_DN8843_c0_g1_i2.p1  ORF type:complete len:108 (-),score=4.46 TRINITY_DN8843_c0_g1_i2:5-328(-)